MSDRLTCPSTQRAAPNDVYGRDSILSNEDSFFHDAIDQPNVTSKPQSFHQRSMQHLHVNTEHL